MNARKDARINKHIKQANEGVKEHERSIWKCILYVPRGSKLVFLVGDVFIFSRIVYGQRSKFANSIPVQILSVLSNDISL